MKKTLIISLLWAISGVAFSEDIELFVSDEVRRAGERPQVLIILDNSNSMNTEMSISAPYDSDTTYPGVGGTNGFSSDFTFFIKGGSDGSNSFVPTSRSQARRFDNNTNGCNTSKAFLDSQGYYTDYIYEYRTTGNANSRGWGELRDNNGANYEIVDCQGDVLSRVNGVNGDPINDGVQGNGFPSTSGIYTANVDDSDVDWGGELVTLFSANYIRWYKIQQTAEAGSENEILVPRIDIAIQTIKDVINANNAIDFGLQIFNYNKGDGPNDGNGGRIISGIKPNSVANQAALISTVDNIVAVTNTPLCESLYEASQYFAGKNVEYGDDDISVSPYVANTPPPDSTIIVNGAYTSPFLPCNNTAHVILITDGTPLDDKAADTNIEAMSVVKNGATVNFSGARHTDNYLAGLAEWMYNYDINPNLDGTQNVATHTIGFSPSAQNAAPILSAAATLGGGNYYYAEDEVQLTNNLLGLLADLAPTNNSLTSASVAANNYDPTETLNHVYYAMFDPQNGPRWQGNLKKYKVIDGVQKGKHNVNALNTGDGHFSPNVTSYWSANESKDGNNVAEGGVAEMLRGKTSRTVYSDVGTNNALVAFNTNLVNGSEAAYATKFAVTEAELDDHINWALGKDTDDVDNDTVVTENRPDIFGDPLHSTPLVINYGSIGTGDEAREDIRILIGTNSGVLHMFEDKGSEVDEAWAIMPQEFFSNVRLLKANASTGSKVYGIDGKITSHIIDINGDGKIEGSDKVWIFFGLRRGGSSYYAIDISTPGSPRLMWHIEAGAGGFEELGQTWSQPKVIYSKLNIADDAAKPVLIFGGGYDEANDSTGPDVNDNVGKAIYMVDAESGALKWYTAKAASSTAPSSAKFTANTAFNESIPSSIGVLDSNGDGLTDRLYTGDTGGDVWRIDMPGADPNDSDDPWTAHKLASVGGPTNATDKRFFNEPSIVRAFITETIETEVVVNNVRIPIVSRQELPYDAVLIGSGDRSNPLGTDTLDTFYMFKDKYITTQSMPISLSPLTPATITVSDVYDYTNDPFSQTLTDDARQDLSIDVSNKSGWFVNYAQSGEKTSSEALVIQGIAYFTSYTPPDTSQRVNICGVPTGQGWLYAVDLSLGVNKYNWTNTDNYDETQDDDERKVLISEQFLGTPTLIVTPDDGDDDKIGDLIVGRKIIPVGFSLNTLRTHLYITEDQ